MWIWSQIRTNIQKKFEPSFSPQIFEAVTQEHYHYFKVSLPALEAKEKLELKKEARQHIVDLLE